jgi:hypothetical protein
MIPGLVHGPLLPPVTVRMLWLLADRIARQGWYHDLSQPGRVRVGMYASPQGGPAFVAISETGAASRGDGGLRIDSMRRTITVLGWALAESDTPEGRIIAGMTLLDDIRASLWGLAYPENGGGSQDLSGQLVTGLTIDSEEVMDGHEIAKGAGAWGVCQLVMGYGVDTIDGRM